MSAGAAERNDGTGWELRRAMGSMSRSAVAHKLKTQMFHIDPHVRVDYLGGTVTLMMDRHTAEVLGEIVAAASPLGSVARAFTPEVTP